MKKVMFLDADGVFILGTPEGGVTLSSKAIELINWITSRGVEVCFVTDRRNNTDPAALLDLFKLYGITGELSMAPPGTDWQAAIQSALNHSTLYGNPISHFVIVDDAPARYAGQTVRSPLHDAALELGEHLVAPCNRFGLLEKSMPEICHLLDLKHNFVTGGLVETSDADL